MRLLILNEFRSCVVGHAVECCLFILDIITNFDSFDISRPLNCHDLVVSVTISGNVKMSRRIPQMSRFAKYCHDKPLKYHHLPHNVTTRTANVAISCDIILCVTTNGDIILYVTTKS